LPLFIYKELPMAIETIASADAFKVFIDEIQSSEVYRQPTAFGIARVDRGQKNAEKVLQANFAVVNWNENFGSAAVFLQALIEARVKIDLSSTEFVATLNDAFVANAMAAFAPYLAEATGDAHKNVQVIKHLSAQEDIGKDYRIVFLFEDAAPQSVEAVYLKLYALSLGKAPLRGVNLNGAFGILANVAWVGNKPYELEYLRENEIAMKLDGTYPDITSVDKFPRFLQHVIPADNTRILDSSKVRMGAQLAPGTTVMPGASYINFNAGTLGPVMVEGRISSSAIVGSGSDVGGGASILGVLSGTDGNPISIGENTLLGANSVTGLPLGDGCIVDAGITVLAGTKIKIAPEQLAKIQTANPDANLENKTTFKGAELQGLHGIHYRVDSTTGEVIARRSTREVKLNTELH
jgi:2,3,4,5-tetrahydropyridine-2-carboxylate N-succinyltransferase